MLKYWREGPEIKLEDGTTIRGATDVSFRIPKHHLGGIKTLEFDENELISFRPILILKMRYSSRPVGEDMMYPASTGNWIVHVVDGVPNVIFTIQSLVNDNRFLLSISDIEDGVLIDAYLIHKYEVSLLSMKRDLVVHKDIFHSRTERPEIFDLLTSESPSWPFIASLVEDVTIPNLTIKDTIRETLEPLVPSSFPQPIRTQVLAFLGWLRKSEIPNEDPIVFRTRYSSADVFRTLVEGHLLCLIDGVKPPPYVRIMMMADQGLLELTDRPIPETEIQNPWVRAEVKIQEMFPDMMKCVIKYAQTLNTQGKILTKLPVTKEEAMKSKTSWSDRLVLSRMGFFMRGYVQRKSVGLKTAIYYGAAHKWPHKHLEMSAKLGFQTSKAPQVQIMVMPPNAVERVTRILKKIHVIDWEMSSLHLSLYNNRNRRWSINSSILIKSLERKRSLRQLRNEFGGWQNKSPISINQRQAKILDLISWGLYLTSLETNQYSNYFNIKNQVIEDELVHLREKGVLSLHYSSVLHKLTSACIFVEGPSSPVCSLSRSFLKHAPSANVRITKDGKTSLIMTRIPEDKAYDLLTVLPQVASENGVHLRALPISSYIAYRNNLYQRLLKDDGTWDADVSGLISQVRLLPKDVED
nr:MAG: hypothetical protein AM325_06575 [Candidatus Thorarchaeota archaeon SMTZ1-45]